MTVRLLWLGLLGLLVVVGVGLALDAGPVAAFTTDGQEDICDRADVFFCENYEQGRDTICLQNGTCPSKYKSPAFGCCAGNGSGAWRVGTVAHDGTKALLIINPGCNSDDQINNNNCKGGRGWFDFLQDTVNRRTVYIRLWQQYRADWVVVNHFEKYLEMNDRAFTPSSWHTWHLRDGSPAYHVVTQGPGEAFFGQNQGNTFNFTPGQWQCFEARFTMNTTPTTSDGTVEFWVNDILRAQHTNIRIRTDPAQNTDGIGSYRFTLSGWGMNPGTGTVPPSEHYIDRIVMATSKIGCTGGTPPPPNTFTLALAAAGYSTTGVAATLTQLAGPLKIGFVHTALLTIMIVAVLLQRRARRSHVDE